MRVHLIHGIHTAGAGPISRLAPFLIAEGFTDIRMPDYGWIAGVESKLDNPRFVGALFPYIESGDVLIGHSNGCAISYELLQRGAPAVAAIFINGALEQRIIRPKGLQSIDCYWNEGDDITEVAQLGEALGLLDPDWGEMGHAGPISDDALVHSINCGNTPGMPKVSGHSDFFTALNLESWGPFLAHRLRAMIESA